MLLFKIATDSSFVLTLPAHEIYKSKHGHIDLTVLVDDSLKARGDDTQMTFKDDTRSELRTFCHPWYNPNIFPCVIQFLTVEVIVFIQQNAINTTTLITSHAITAYFHKSCKNKIDDIFKIKLK